MVGDVAQRFLPFRGIHHERRACDVASNSGQLCRRAKIACRCIVPASAALKSARSVECSPEKTGRHHGSAILRVRRAHFEQVSEAYKARGRSRQRDHAITKSRVAVGPRRWRAPTKHLSRAQQRPRRPVAMPASIQVSKPMRRGRSRFAL